MMIAVIATFLRCDMPPLNIYHTTLFRELQAHIKSHTIVRQNMIILAHFAVIALESSFVVCYNYFLFRCFFYVCDRLLLDGRTRELLVKLANHKSSHP